MSEKENATPSVSQEAPQTPTDEAKNACQSCCCGSFSNIAAVVAIAVIKGSTVMLCAASVLLSLFAVFMFIPAVGWMMRAAVHGGSALSALFVLDDLLVPPFALLMLYGSLRLMRKIMAFVNGNPHVQKAEESFRFARCSKAKAPDAPASEK